MLHLFNTIAALQAYLATVEDRSVGLVPTMGALHAGHLSLIERSRQENDVVIVSIFVNPLQFAPNEDLERYPRPAKEDQALCESVGADAIFMPSPEELYGSAQPDLSTVTQVVPPVSMVDTLCGHSRPTHFQGVATVVTKLLNLVKPTRAYFGQKDAQQAAIIKKLHRDLHLPGQIMICPIVREPGGLALSSRNRYLVGEERQQATVLSRSLRAAQNAFNKGERDAAALLQVANEVFDSEPNVTLDYLSLVHPDTLKPLQVIDSVGMMAIAGYVGTAPESPEAADTRTRILDNILLHHRQPIIAIDGPAGAGKSTVSRQLAHQLGLLYLDTGAMYRALTWYVLSKGIDPADESAVERLLLQCDIQLVANVKDDKPQPPQVKVNDEEVTQAIRTPTVTAQVSTIAAQSAVRTKLVEQQQQYGREGGVVADGRDIGTKVFPDAELKIFLTASVEERAQRRYRDLKNAAQASDSGVLADDLPTIGELASAIEERDRKDSTRVVSPLKKADDAIEIVTDDLSAEQVIEKLSYLYHQLRN